MNPIAVLREHANAVVDVWTLNEGDDGLEGDLGAALDAGADQITTDTTVELAERVERP